MSAQSDRQKARQDTRNRKGEYSDMNLGDNRSEADISLGTPRAKEQTHQKKISALTETVEARSQLRGIREQLDHIEDRYQGLLTVGEPVDDR